MPQISIIQSNEYHNLGSYDQNGTACKFLVEQLLQIAPEFQLDSVVSDTSEKYEAYVRLRGGRVGIRLRNIGRTFYIELTYFEKNGSRIQLGASDSHTYFFGDYRQATTPSPSWYPLLKVATVGVDDAMKYVFFCSSYSSQGCFAIPIGMFTHQGSPDAVRCIGAITQPEMSYPTLPAVFGTALPIYTHDTLTDYYIDMSFLSMTDRDGFVKAGHTHALMPTAYYTETNGYMGVKWGGLYDMYKLYDTNGVVTTGTGETVNIDGVDVLSAGEVVIFA